MATRKMTLEDWLDDLCVRFIINLPKADLSSVARICFQIEEAQWFYEDFIRLIDPTLPSMSLRSFTLKMFEYCPLLASFSAEEHIRAFEEFMTYKTRVPVRGAILLNDTMDAVVLVRGFKKGATWSFPRGKINMDEDDLDCAVREVYEEIGYDIREAGLITENSAAQYFEVTMQGQQVRLYVFRGIPENTVFGTRTRKEIGAIKWYKVEELPTYRKKKGGRMNGTGGPGNEKFYMVAPFMVQLRQWVSTQRKLDTRKVGDPSAHNHPPASYEETTDENVMQEPAQSSAAPSTYPELIDNATRELQRLLRVRPQTDQHAGHALMSLLQPGNAAGSEVHRHVQENDVDARTVQHQHQHHHHLYHHHPPEPPQYSTEVRPRPYVTYVNATTGPEDNYQSVLSEKFQQSQNQSVQLVHPQPLPPQVQKAMLLRDVIPSSSPQIAEHSSGRPAFPGFSQSNQYASQDQSAYVHRAQAAQPERQLPAHSANLLNVLKGNVSQPDAGQSLAPRLPSQPASRSPENSSQHQFPMPGKAFVGKQRASATPSEYSSIPVNGVHANPSSSDARLLRPTDKHRAGLLEMFKKAEPVAQNQLDGEEMTRRTSQLGEDAKKQRSSKVPSTASVLQTAAHEHGEPLQTHPEANLPFRALSILSRPKPGQEQGESTVSRPSPSFKKASPRANHPVSSKAQPFGQSYPYGSTQPNPLSLFPTPPSASSLPVPGGFQFRQESTEEQRSTLLSLFGKPKSNFEQSKGKEALMPDQSAANAAPRSQLSSVASSRGEAKPVLRGNASRRGSQTPLSPADREFLLNFLETASSNARR
ncbi:uncharacterized protein F4807DRAFT_415451 [Annulohypoxylon truncatum]|uniref:uncharacterized protein n=1 Tax=Annulohypoxylon truncatum TaxID=327061 RepID=UPI0020082A6E|nr:uncharacterized protein F4807DRAFT_415451 [Annulohypoxylon truncatum]KAI1212282.1 hypothetical protein F4807DRAFT_415451 [Annulohypoxylon truncatum]